MHGSDVVDLEIWQDFLAEFAPGSVPGFLTAITQHQAGPAKNNQGRQKKDQLFAIHFAAVRLRFTKARTTPVTATSTGIRPMFRDFCPKFEGVCLLGQLFPDRLEFFIGVSHGFLIILQFLLLFGGQDEPLFVAGLPAIATR